MKNRTAGTLAGLLAVLATLVPTGVAGAQAQYPPAAQTVTVNRTEVPAGGSVEVSGTAARNSTVTFSLPARVLGTALTNNVGAFRAAVTIPCDVPAGATTLSTTGPGINASTRLNVQGSADVCPRVAGTVGTAGDPGTAATGGTRGDVAGAGGNLPRTGSSSTAPLVAAGVGLVLIGAATAVTARRRRTADGA